MAIIYSYPEKTSPSGGDFLVITDSEQPAPNKNRTKSLKLSDLADFVISSKSGITGGGTVNTIAMFTPTGAQMGNSIITQSTIASNITISGNATFTGGVQVANETQTNELLVFNQAEFNGECTFDDSMFINGPLYDETSSAGSAGQVLSSTSQGVAWVSDGEGFTSYVAKITQSGSTASDAPVATVINNNTGLTPTWSRSNTGDYRLSGINGVSAFIQVTGGDSSSAATATTLLVKSVNPSQIQIVNLKIVDGQPADGITLGFIEVRKYS